ncbi:MAG: thermonuclease family protein, partial [Cyanobium sp.]
MAVAGAGAALRLVGLLPSLLPTLVLALPAQAATVLSIGDGDTLRVLEGGQKMTIRLARIDAPEMAQAPFGAQSRALLTSLAPVGTEVSLKVVATDRHGRSVAEILQGNRNVNLQMVRRGQAFAYRQYLGNCNGTAYL